MLSCFPFCFKKKIQEENNNVSDIDASYRGGSLRSFQPTITYIVNTNIPGPVTAS